ncbi:MAG: metal-dependent hydrolase [Bdellovibrionales bacterium]|nr:metal-dependent hydrolase [Bdellovibrionales bacterium]
MTEYRNHITFSIVVGICYALGGMYLLNLDGETSMLALAIIAIAGILPDIDAKNGAPAREVGAILSAVAPIAILEAYPHFKAGGMVRIALVVVVCYLVTRVFVVRGLKKFTVHRGMMHSIPAAIITFQLAFLLFYDLFLLERLYVSVAAFVGFMSHLFLDATSNLDLVGKAMGSEERPAPVLKVLAKSWVQTAAVYSGMLVLGWYMFRELYPSARFIAGVQY